MPAAIFFDKLQQTIPRPNGTREPNQRFWRGLYAFGTLAHLAYSTDPALVDKGAALAGYGPGALVVTPGVLTPNYICAANGQGVLLAIAGTTDESQIHTYADMCMLLNNGALNSVQTYAGFSFLFRRLYPLIDAQLAAIPAGTPISITGHSLGGAIAAMYAVRVIQQGKLVLKNCITFGCPVVGDFSFYNEFLGSDAVFLQVRNSSDVIPMLPPAFLVWHTGGKLLAVRQLLNDFNGVTPSLYLDERDSPIRFTAFWTRFTTALRLADRGVIGVGLTVGAYETYVFDLHKMASYQAIISSRAFAATPRAGGEDAEFRAIAEIDFALRDKDPAALNPPAPQPVLPNAAAYWDPNVTLDWNTVEATPGPLPTPGTVEVRIVTSNRSSRNRIAMTQVLSGGPAVGLDEPGPEAIQENNGLPSGTVPTVPAEYRPPWEFQGADRNLLKRLRLVLIAMLARDLRATDQTPTKALSTRAQFFPWDYPNLVNAVFSIIDQLESCLDTLRYATEGNTL